MNHLSDKEIIRLILKHRGGIRKRFAFVLAVIYASVLTSLPIDAFIDRSNYLSYAANSAYILLSLLELNVVPLLANEPLWLATNIALRQVLSVENTTRVLIFIPAFIVTYISMRASGRYWPFMLLMLLSPQIVKNHIAHLRQGFGISIFLMGWHNRSTIFKMISPFFHASFFFILLIDYASRFLKIVRLDFDLRMIGNIILGLTISFSLPWLAVAFGARQADYYDFEAANVSGLGFLFWGGMTVLMMCQGKRWLRAHTFETGIIVFYLATYFFIEVTARIFESAMLIVILSGLTLTDWRKILFLYFMFLYFILQWVMHYFNPAF